MMALNLSQRWARLIHPSSAEEWPEPSLDHPISQLCTESQFKAYAYRYWCREIRETPRFHRKQWEFCYILQALAVRGRLAPGMAGLGFGVGLEPLAAAIAARGAHIVATDLPQDTVAARAWIDTKQHAARLEALNDRKICDPDIFGSNVRFREVDMNDLPPDLGDFDFIWSACALEHLGSLQNGADFILNALDVLRPGGVAVHTTEFNMDDDGSTLDFAETVLFRRRDVEPIIKAAARKGFRCLCNWNPGSGELDSYIDAPPYREDRHLRLAIGAYRATSCGLVFERVGR
jgi:SAM-dependent methyltransferase